MHVSVLGAGVVGVTTAYYLAELGYSVTVFDTEPEPGNGASGDNGGQLSYSFTDAMANPAFLFKLPKILAGTDPAFLLRPEFNTDLIGWGLGFLGQCTRKNTRLNTLAVLELAMRSSVLIRQLQEQTQLEFSYRRAGKLVMLADREQKESAIDSIEMKRAAGCDLELLSVEQACDIEPALSNFKSNYRGAIWSRGDEVGDTRAFTLGLSRWLARHRGVRFELDSQVDKLLTTKGRFSGIEVRGEKLDFDACVVCLGAWSPKLLRPLGIRLNIYPVRGYSLTFPAGGSPASVSITDLASKIVFSRLDGHIRIAGFADFTGFSDKRDEARFGQLLQKAIAIAPEIADYSVPDKKNWAGLRPMTPDSRPLVGPTKVEGLFMNTGHGVLGWTLACSTAKDVSHSLNTSSS